MKITISPAGEAVFETEDPDEALKFVTALLNGKQPAAAKKAPRAKKKPLSPALQGVVDELSSKDGEPVGTVELATALGINPPAMAQRLRNLAERKLVARADDGRWTLR